MNIIASFPLEESEVILLEKMGFEEKALNNLINFFVKLNLENNTIILNDYIENYIKKKEQLELKKEITYNTLMNKYFPQEYINDKDKMMFNLNLDDQEIRFFYANSNADQT